MSMAEAYHTLELKYDGSTREGVVKAWKRLQKRWHPDKNDNSRESTERTQKLNSAKDVIIRRLEELDSHRRELERMRAGRRASTSQSPGGQGGWLQRMLRQQEEWRQARVCKLQQEEEELQARVRKMQQEEEEQQAQVRKRQEQQKQQEEMLRARVREEARVSEEMLRAVPRVRQTSAKHAALIEELFRRHRSDRDEMLRKKQKEEMLRKQQEERGQEVQAQLAQCPRSKLKKRKKDA